MPSSELKDDSVAYRVLITGGNGNLAQHLTNELKHNSSFKVFAPSKEELDITDEENIRNYLDDNKVDCLIHAAALTRPMHKHQKNPELSIHINIIGTALLSVECHLRSIKLIYISTDYVYPGLDGYYSENSGLSPYSISNDGISKYGWSKLGGECSVRMLANSLIIRACICDFPFPHEAALVDVKKSLIYAKDAAPLIIRLIGETGVINLGGKSQSVYDFAKKDSPNIKCISRNEVSDANIAPNTSMDISKLENLLKYTTED